MTIEPTKVPDMADAERLQRRAREVFDPIADELLTRPGVDRGSMFGSEGIRIRGKVFAIVGHAGDLIVKLPTERIDELIGESAGKRLVMAQRPMREWMRVDRRRSDRWRAIAAEAYDFVDSITPADARDERNAQ